MLDIDLFYREAGEGEAFLLLHGNGEDSSFFENQIEEFSRYYHVFALDTRGHGQSPMGEKDFTISQFADDLYDFLLEHDIDYCNILGFSDGGNIALTFALRHPEMIDHLVLNSANIFPEGIRDIYLEGIVGAYEKYKAIAEESEENYYQYRLMALMVEEPNFTPEDLAELPMQCLVIAGNDEIIDVDHTKMIADAIPNSDLYIMQGDHFLAANQPALYNAIVLNFCWNR